MKETAAREALIETGRRMNAFGINQGRSGNLSVRCDDGFLITPSGVAYEDMTPSDIVKMDFDGSWHCRRSSRRPSSEWRFHRDILATRSEFGAIVHCHACNATALACLGRGIPAFHYMVAVAGGDDIRCARYATFGTEALSKHALAALEERKACLLANHGLIACDNNLGSALELAVEVESLAAQYLAALSVGEPKVLTKPEMRRVLAKFAAPDGYGSSPARRRR